MAPDIPATVDGPFIASGSPLACCSASAVVRAISLSRAEIRRALNALSVMPSLAAAAWRSPCDTPKGLLLSLCQALRRLRDFVKLSYRCRDHLDLVIREFPLVMRKIGDRARLDRTMRDGKPVMQPVVGGILRIENGWGSAARSSGRRRSSRSPRRWWDRAEHRRVRNSVAPIPCYRSELHQRGCKADMQPDEVTRRESFFSLASAALISRETT